MTLIKLATECGVTFVRCRPEWAGTWAYKDQEYPNTTIAGFKTKKEAAEAWVKDSMNSRMFTILQPLIETLK